MECVNAKCGMNALFLDSELALSSHGHTKSYTGYWPWYAKITMNGAYYCDGTLLSMDTILAQASCFDHNHIQGQHLQRHNLSASLGSIRYQQDNVEARTYAIQDVNIVKSLSSGTTWHLIKLNQTVDMSMHIGPACHSHEVASSVHNHDSVKCVVLHMNYEHDELQYKQVRIVPIDQCIEHDRPSGHDSGTTAERDHRNTSTTTTTTTTSTPYWTNRTSWNEVHYDNKLCVEMASAESSSPVVSSSAERHLYCNYQHKWYMFAVEQRRVASLLSSSSYNHHHHHQQQDRRRNLFLFETMTKLQL